MQTAEQLNNSDWRKNWSLNGNVLTHTSGIEFVITEVDGRVNVTTPPEKFMEFQNREFAKGKTSEDIQNLFKELAPQVQAFYHEAVTGGKTSFARLQ